MMHVMGSPHAGEYDSFDGHRPTMSTCLSYILYPTTNILEQDGHIEENYRFSDLPYTQMHANIGFEQGTRFWGRSGGQFNEHNSGGSSGPGYVGWYSEDLSDYMYQTVRVLNGWDDLSYRGRINAKHPPDPDYETQVRVRLYYRTVDLPRHPGSSSCDWPNGIDDANGLPDPGLWTVLTGSDLIAVPVGGWVVIDTSNPQEFVDPPSAEAYDFQVRVNGKARKGPGDFHQIPIDDVRGDIG